MKNKKGTLFLVDTIIVLLNIAGGRGNYLLYFLLGISKATWVVAFVLTVDLLYLIVRFGRTKTRVNHKKALPIYLIIVLLLYNILNVMLHGGSSIYVLELLLLDILFFIILIKIYSCLLNNDKTKSPISLIKYISSGYIWLSLMSIIGVVISFTMMQIGYNNNVPIYADFMESNTENGCYYVRSFLSVNYITANIRLPFFQDFGYLCGLFHEPHILTYGVYPALIILLGLATKNITRVIIVFLMVSMTLFSISVTNILVALVCLVVFLIIQFRRNIIGAIILAIFIGAILMWYVNYDDTVLNFVLERIDSDNSSQQASKDLLTFAFSPRSLLGTDFLSTTYVKEGVRNQDIGYIAFFFFVTYLLLYARNLIKLLRIPKIESLTIGIASLYFILHSLKIGMTMFIQTVSVLIIFLQIIVIEYYGRNKTFRRSISKGN